MIVNDNDSEGGDDDALTAMNIPLGPLKLSIQPWCGKQVVVQHTVLH